MSYRFDLSVVRVECRNEAVDEWGKDELRLIGFGIRREGTVFATGYRELGSYHTGDVRSGAQLAPPLFGGDLPDDGLEVLFYAWLIEKDSGGARSAAAAPEAELRESYREKTRLLTEAQFPRECVPFTAFYEAILPLAAKLEEAADHRDQRRRGLRAGRPRAAPRAGRSGRDGLGPRRHLRALEEPRAPPGRPALRLRVEPARDRLRRPRGQPAASISLRTRAWKSPCSRRPDSHCVAIHSALRNASGESSSRRRSR